MWAGRSRPGSGRGETPPVFPSQPRGGCDRIPVMAAVGCPPRGSPPPATLNQASTTLLASFFHPKRASIPISEEAPLPLPGFPQHNLGPNIGCRGGSSNRSDHAAHAKESERSNDRSTTMSTAESTTTSTATDLSSKAKGLPSCRPPKWGRLGTALALLEIKPQGRTVTCPPKVVTQPKEHTAGRQNGSHCQSHGHSQPHTRHETQEQHGHGEHQSPGFLARLDQLVGRLRSHSVLSDSEGEPPRWAKSPPPAHGPHGHAGLHEEGEKGERKEKMTERLDLTGVTSSRSWGLPAE